MTKRGRTGRLGTARSVSVALLAAALACAAPALAQSVDGDLGDIHSNAGYVGIDARQINLENECGKSVGCIILANNSDRYELIEVDVDVKTRRERAPRWTNMIEEGRSVGPHKVFMIPRIGDDKLAVVGLHAVLKDPVTHDRQTIVLGDIDLRPDPQKRLFVNFLRFAPPAPPADLSPPAGSKPVPSQTP